MSVNPTDPVLVSTSDLRTAVATMAQYVGLTRKGRGTPTPVAITGADGRITLSASATSGLSIVRSLPGEMDGSAVVKLSDVKDALRVCSGPLTLTRGPTGSLAIADACASFVLPAVENDIVAASLPDAEPVSMIGLDLISALRRMAYAMAGAENRYQFSGACVETVPGGNRFVATDGNRLAYTDMATEAPIVLPKNTILPRELVTLILALPGSERLSIRVYERTASVAAEAWTVSARLKEAEFPDYRQVLPATYTGTIIGDRDALTRAFRRLGAIQRDRCNAVKVVAKDGALNLSARRHDGIHASAVVPVGIEGAVPVMGFNGVFVAQALASLPPGPVRWDVSTTLSPARMMSMTTGAMAAIVMPIRID